MHRGVLLLSLGLGLLGAATAAADAPEAGVWHDVTLVLQDGWSYEGVTVRADPTDATILLVERADGATRRLRRADVRVIRDASGRDLTREIVGETAPAPAPGPYSEIGVAAPPTPATPDSTAPLPFDAMLSGGVGIGHGFADFYEGLQDRVAWHVQLRVPVTATTYLSVLYRNQQLLRDQIGVYDPDADIYLTSDAALDLKQYLFLVGVLDQPRGAARSYAEFGGGYGDHVATASAGGVSGQGSLGRFLLAGQFGVLLELGPHGPSLDLGISLIAKLFGGASGETSGFVAGAHGGLAFAFGQR